jgi:hypothetical protein
MTNPQAILDAFVRLGFTFAHRESLRREVPLNAASFDVALETLIAERLLTGRGVFYTMTPWGFRAHARTQSP